METSELKVLGYDPSYVTSCNKYRRYTEMWCFDIRYIRTETSIRSISKADTHILKKNK